MKESRREYIMLLVGVASLNRKCKRRHSKLGKILHWNLVKKCNFKVKGKWHRNKTESNFKSENCKFLWHFSIQTDHAIEFQRLNLVLVNKKNRTC